MRQLSFAAFVALIMFTLGLAAPAAVQAQDQRPAGSQGK